MPRRIPYFAISDLFGNPRSASIFRQGHSYLFSGQDFSEPEDPPVSPSSEEEVRTEMFRDILDALERYEQSGRFSTKELFAMWKTWLEGWTLERIGAAQGVSRQAIRERICGNRRGQGGVLKKAPEFAAWWRYRNRKRQRGKE
jgi:hypothetical protein